MKTETQLTVDDASLNREELKGYEDLYFGIHTAFLKFPIADGYCLIGLHPIAETLKNLAWIISMLRRRSNRKLDLNTIRGYETRGLREEGLFDFIEDETVRATHEPEEISSGPARFVRWTNPPWFEDAVRRLVAANGIDSVLANCREAKGRDLMFDLERQIEAWDVRHAREQD